MALWLRSPRLPALLVPTSRPSHILLSLVGLRRPIYFFGDGGGDPLLNIGGGENDYPLNDVFVHAAREGDLGLAELCKQLGASSNDVVIDKHTIIN